MPLHHVAGAFDRDVAVIREVGAACGALWLWEAHRRLCCVDDQDGTGDALPVLRGGVAAKRVGTHREMERVMLPRDPIGEWPRAGLGEVTREWFAQKGVVLAEPRDGDIERCHRLELPARVAPRMDPLSRTAGELCLGLIRWADSLEEGECREARRIGASPVGSDATAHRVTNEHETFAREARDDFVEIRDVVEEVVVAAGTDPVAVTVTSQVGCDDVDVRSQFLGERAKTVSEIEEAVDEKDRRVTWRVPFEDVVGEARREREATSLQGPASIWKTLPPTVVRNSSPRASL